MKKGFTLIELLIVVTIIGLLTLFFLPKLDIISNKTDETQNSMLIKSLDTALFSYQLDKRSMPRGSIYTPSPDVETAIKNKLNELGSTDINNDYSNLLNFMFKIDKTKLKPYVSNTNNIDKFFLIEDNAPYLAGSLISTEKLKTVKGKYEIVFLGTNGLFITNTNTGNNSVDYNTIKTLSSFGYTTIFLKNDGTVWGWGANVFGGLGTNNTNRSMTPVQVLGPGGSGYLTDVKSIATGYYHTLALKKDGTVWSWGYNNHGQLGNNATTDKLTPVQVLGSGGSGYLTDVKSITAGSYYSLALKSDGTVWGWGEDDWSQLADNSTTDKLTPVQALDSSGSGYLTNVKSITAGHKHSLVLKNDGTVWGWGYNGYGQIGNGNNVVPFPKRPVQVLDSSGTGFLTDVKNVVAGPYFSLAVKNDGSVWSWGYNNHGQLGDNSTTNRVTPVQVLGSNGSGFLTDVKNITAGDSHSVALKNDGSVWSWGYNYHGQLGDNTKIDKYTPVQVLNSGAPGYLSNVKNITAGDSFSIVLKDDGTVWGWGSGADIAKNSYSDFLTPVQALGSGGVGYFTE